MHYTLLKALCHVFPCPQYGVFASNISLALMLLLPPFVPVLLTHMQLSVGMALPVLQAIAIGAHHAMDR